MHEIKSFHVFQTAKVMGVWYGVIGVIMAFLWFVALMARGRPLAALAALIFGPIVYGIATFVMTAIATWLYNEVASRVGGVQFELTQKTL
ncbi:MAG: hypothetical protein ACREQB_04920 [Candidatus Binataceae bacterium]